MQIKAVEYAHKLTQYELLARYTGAQREGAGVDAPLTRGDWTIGWKLLKSRYIENIILKLDRPWVSLSLSVRAHARASEFNRAAMSNLLLASRASVPPTGRPGVEAISSTVYVCDINGVAQRGSIRQLMPGLRGSFARNAKLTVPSVRVASSSTW